MPCPRSQSRTRRRVVDTDGAGGLSFHSGGTTDMMRFWRLPSRKALTSETALLVLFGGVLLLLALLLPFILVWAGGSPGILEVICHVP